MRISSPHPSRRLVPPATTRRESCPIIHSRLCRSTARRFCGIGEPCFEGMTDAGAGMMVILFQAVLSSVGGRSSQRALVKPPVLHDDRNLRSTGTQGRNIL